MQFMRNNIRFILCFSLLITIPLCLFTQVSWPQFRGQNGQGISGDSKPLPAEFSEKHNLLWKCNVSEGISSPVVWDNKIILTGIRGDTLVTICINRHNGEKEWTRFAHAEKVERTHPIGSAASPSVVTDGVHIISYFGSYGLICYDFHGKKIWERKIPQQGNMYGVAVSPIIYENVLFLNRDANQDPYLEAIEPSTGETLWHKDRPGFKANWSTPMIFDNNGQKEILVYGIWWLKSYSLKDGTEHWSFPGLTDEPVTTPVEANGLIYVTTYNMKTNPEVLGLPTWDSIVKLYDKDLDGMITLNEARANQSILSRYDADGEGDHPLWGFHRWLDEDKDGKLTEKEWQKMIGYIDSFMQDNALLALRPSIDAEKDPEVVWRHTLGVPECPSPVYINGLIYMIKNGGIISCLDANTGELKYQEKLDAGGPYYASLVYGDGKVYAASARGVITVIEAADDFQILAQNDLNERLMATPALVDGVVYLRTFGKLWAFGQKD